MVAEAEVSLRQGSRNFSVQETKQEGSMFMAEFFRLELHLNYSSYEKHELTCGFKMPAQSRCTTCGNWRLTWVSASLQLAQPSPTAGHQLFARDRHEDSADLLFH